ncbi:MAG: retropepsin-like aspartic protease, partial [Planctomycetota bacterium]
LNPKLTAILGLFKSTLLSAYADDPILLNPTALISIVTSNQSTNIGRPKTWINLNSLTTNDLDPDFLLPFTADDYNQLFKKETYVVHGTVGMGNLSLSRNVTMDTAAGPNLIRTSLVKPEWEPYIRPIPRQTRLTGAGGRPLNLHGVLPLRVTLGRQTTKIWFGIVDELPPGVLLGTSFHDKHVKSIRPDKRIIQLRGAPSIPILNDLKDNSINAINRPEPLDDYTVFPTDDTEEKLRSIRLAKTVRIPAQSQVVVQVTSRLNGFYTISPHWRTNHKMSVMAANGIANVKTSQPFDIYLANFGNSTVTLPKNMRVAYASNPPEIILNASTRGRSESKLGGGTRPSEKLNKELQISSDDYRQRTKKLEESLTERRKTQFEDTVMAYKHPTFDRRGQLVHKKPQKLKLQNSQGTARTVETYAGRIIIDEFSVSSVSKNYGVRSGENIDKHLEVTESDKEELKKNWRDAINIYDSNEDLRTRLEQTLEPFQHMWDGRIGTVNITTHQIDLEPGAKPVFQPPYRAGPRQRELEHIELSKMLNEDVI